MRRILAATDAYNTVEPTDEQVRILLCGPSDRGEDSQDPYPNEDVYIIEWRSPMGDDLRVVLPPSEMPVKS